MKLKFVPHCLLALLTVGIWQMPGAGQDPPVRKNKPSEPRPAPLLGPQGDRPAPPDWGRPQGPNFRPPSFEMFSDRKVVKGAPYSATSVTETVQTLADGARITHKKTDNIYRDGEGRTRREQTLDRVGPFSVGEGTQQIVFINDVVAGVVIFLDPARHTARKTSQADRPAPRMGPPDGRFPNHDERKTESLGKQMIEGVEAEGTRTTVTIPAGKIGNDRPLEIVSERWEATALQVVVLSKHKDPFVGETVYRLTNIKLGEPARTLFEIPSDYTLEENPRGRAPWDGRRRPPQE